MTTFDDILRIAEAMLRPHAKVWDELGGIAINRDLNSRVRLLVPESVKTDPIAQQAVDAVALALQKQLGAHAFPADRAVLYEENLAALWGEGVSSFLLADDLKVHVLDRLATEGDWARISPLKGGKAARRIVFFSIKGGVGRSTALAAAAWSLAQKGKRVLVMDLDLESPGLSSSLLQADRCPTFGVVDWLVEDLVDNADAVFQDMLASSPLSRDGEIYVVPAHGNKSGEYISKLGRAWMPKLGADGGRESFAQRLNRLTDACEQRLKPDVIFMDARSGIDEVACASVTGLGADLVLLFALDAEQTWFGLRSLFQLWGQFGVVRDIRERLQLVGALIPEIGAEDYVERLRERAWTEFSEALYDEVLPGELVTENQWTFDQSEEATPHNPWLIRWHRNWAALRSLQGHLSGIDSDQVNAVFGPLVKGLEDAINE
jgi:CobQ/CobB/MinD/ParA nucleotide binding domain